MRTVYRQLLDTFSHDLILYCDLADKAMTMASTALTKAELQPAEDVLGLSDHAEEPVSYTHLTLPTNREV